MNIQFVDKQNDKLDPFIKCLWSYTLIFGFVSNLFVRMVQVNIDDVKHL